LSFLFLPPRTPRRAKAWAFYFYHRKHREDIRLGLFIFTTENTEKS